MSGDFFENLDRLRLLPSQREPQPEANRKGTMIPAKPKRVRGEFLKGPIPLKWLSCAARLRGKAPLAAALAIMFEAGRRRSNEIILTSAILARFGVNRKAKYRALDALEGANLIAVIRQPRRNPVVTVLEVDDGSGVDGVCQGVPGDDGTGPFITSLFIRKEKHT
jgi:hypothetical protein